MMAARQQQVISHTHTHSDQGWSSSLVKLWCIACCSCRIWQKKNLIHTHTHTHTVCQSQGVLFNDGVIGVSRQITWRLWRRIPADCLTFIYQPWRHSRAHTQTHTFWVWVSHHRGERGCWKLAFWQVLTLIIHDDAEPQTRQSQL